MHLTIEGVGKTLINRKLVRFEQSLAVPAGALLETGVSLRHMIEGQFDSQGANSGGWKPLAPSTVAEKQRQGLDPRILIATGRLKESLTRKFSGDHIEEMLSPTTLRFGSRVPYGAFHQTGTSRMPKRPPLALSPADRVALVKVLQRALMDTGAHPFARGRA